jgi:uncharacterized protein (TIGR02118 family)
MNARSVVVVCGLALTVTGAEVRIGAALRDDASTPAAAQARANATSPRPAQGVAPQAAEVVSMNVVYPNHPGARFDIQYYRNTHIPLVMKVMQADRVMLIEGVAMGDAAPPFAMIAHFQFSSTEALQAALARPGMAEVRADVARFTDIRPAIMFGKSS